MRQERSESFRVSSVHRVIWAVAALGLVMAACGDDDDNGSSATAEESADVATTEVDSTDPPAPSTTGDAPVSSSPEAPSDSTPAESTTVPATSPVDEAAFEALVSAAEEEGELLVYSSIGPDNLTSLVEAFEAEYDIDVEAVRMIDADLFARVDAERNAGKIEADVLMPASIGNAQQMSDDGELAPLFEGPSLNNPDLDRDRFVHGDYFNVQAAIVTFGWNTDLVPEGVAGYEEFLDPKFSEGKIGVPAASSAAFVDFYLFLEENFGEDFVVQLAAQNPRIYPSSLPMGEAMSAGEIYAGIFINPTADLEAAGAPVSSIIPPVVWGAHFYASAMADATNSNAAQLFLDFSLSPEGQAALCLHNYGAVLRSPDLCDGRYAADVREQNPAQLTPELVAEYQQKWQSLFEG